MIVYINKAYKAVNKMLLFIVAVLFVASSVNDMKPYGVFLGISRDESDKLKVYKTIVIEPSEFTKEDIEAFHVDGKIVYAYLNIGAVEECRPYYGEFEGITLGRYEDWPDEKWVDVSSEKWRFFIVEVLGKMYADMGFDGFFMDNADVYYHYDNDRIYEGLKTILTGLRQYGLILIINGGDVFVQKMLDEAEANKFFDGINQETVFTAIDFDDKTYHEQSEEQNEYFKAYLDRVHEGDLLVYLLEYRATPGLKKEIENYCDVRGFVWYNAPSFELR